MTVKAHGRKNIPERSAAARTSRASDRDAELLGLRAQVSTLNERLLQERLRSKAILANAEADLERDNLAIAENIAGLPHRRRDEAFAQIDRLVSSVTGLSRDLGAGMRQLHASIPEADSAVIAELRELLEAKTGDNVRLLEQIAATAKGEAGETAELTHLRAELEKLRGEHLQQTQAFLVFQKDGYAPTWVAEKFERAVATTSGEARNKAIRKFVEDVTNWALAQRERRRRFELALAKLRGAQEPIAARHVDLGTLAADGRVVAVCGVAIEPEQTEAPAGEA